MPFNDNDRLLNYLCCNSLCIIIYYEYSKLIKYLAVMTSLSS